MSEVAQYQVFFERWRNEIIKPNLEHHSEFLNPFIRFRDEYMAMKAETERISLIRAPGYNVFSLLGVSRNELKHSTFLANLLDPHGSHGQGALFLYSFLEYCVNLYSDFPFSSEDKNSGKWSIIPELGIINGRLDIAIMNAYNGILILIENKVDAYEQSDQLARYWEWMVNKNDDFKFQALIFLTISGYEASSSGAHPYYRLSYHQDIPAWLEPLIIQIQAPGVREVVRQYMEIIHVL
jgi:hypothetical protein